MERIKFQEFRKAGLNGLWLNGLNELNDLNGSPIFYNMATYDFASIKRVLIKRDGMTPMEADDLIKEDKVAFRAYLSEGMLSDAYDICEEYFGLEPDYLEAFLG